MKQNKNLKNNQNYILGTSLKNKIISSFLSYKKNETYFKEKNPILTMAMDSVSDFIIIFLDIFYYIFNSLFKLNKFFSLALILAIYSILNLFIIYLFLTWKNEILLVFSFIIFFIFYRTITIFIKSKIDISNYYILLKKPFKWKYKANFQDNKSIENKIWVTKNLVIKKEKRSYSDEMYKLVVLVLLIWIILIVWLISFKNYQIEKKLAIKKIETIDNIYNWKDLFLFEKEELNNRLLKCYKDNYPFINTNKYIDENKFPSNWIIKDACENNENEIKEIIIKNRKQYTKKEIYKKVNEEENNLYLKALLKKQEREVNFYKISIYDHNILIKYNSWLNH